MWPDGICRVTDTRYTKTIQYQDINYQLSQNEDKTAIFEAVRKEKADPHRTKTDRSRHRKSEPNG